MNSSTVVLVFPFYAESILFVNQNNTIPFSSRRRLLGIFVTYRNTGITGMIPGLNSAEETYCI